MILLAWPVKRRHDIHLNNAEQNDTQLNSGSNSLVHTVNW